MPFVDERVWIEQRIEATRAMIVAYEEAILQLGTNNVATYTLDTGQTRQTVTKQQLGSLRIQLDGLENRLRFYQNQLNGGAAVIVRPGY